ncbi:MAG TPA: DUF4388 domain-containing protein [Polyangiaceae bacterium]
MSAHLVEAVGTLEATPFADLLVRAHDGRITGTLVLEEPGGKRHGIYFSEGEPTRAKVSSPGAHLGEVLVERGQLSADLYRATLERALLQHVLHGRLLVEEGILSEAAVDDALREQLMRQLLWLFGQPRETKFGYFAGTNYLEQWGGPPNPSIRLLELLWLGIRDHARSFEVEQALARIGGRRVELCRGLPPDHFAFLGEDGGLIERLRTRPARITELLGGDAAPDSHRKRVLYFLVLSRSLELDVPSAPPVGIDRSSSVSEPPSVPPAPRVPSFEQRDSRRALPASNPVATREAARALRAQAAFQKAEAFLQRGNLEMARLEAKLALEHDPTKLDHIALNAYLSLFAPAPNPREVLSELDRALESLEAGIKVHWYRGLALKRLGRHASALREFRTVVEEDPHHIDAAREVHIYEERLRNSPKDRLSLAPEPEQSVNPLDRALKRLWPKR